MTHTGHKDVCSKGGVSVVVVGLRTGAAAYNYLSQYHNVSSVCLYTFCIVRAVNIRSKGMFVLALCSEHHVPFKPNQVFHVYTADGY